MLARRVHAGGAPDEPEVVGPTLLGVLDGAVTASVAGDGTVHAGQLVLRPWVGAGDRWHRFDQEVALRQRLFDDAPVVETLLHVAGGDVVWRTYGARPAGGGEALVVELENRSRLPVALALVVERVPPGPLRIEGPALWPGGPERPGQAALVVGARAPGHALSGDDLDELFERLGRELAEEAGPAPDAGPPSAPGRLVALVHPVTHGTTSTFVAPLAGPPPAAGALGGLPPADTVARGWRTLLGSSALVDLPDPTWASATTAARAQLLLGAAARVELGHVGAGESGGAAGLALGAAVRALDGWGHHLEAGRLLGTLAGELATSLDPDLSAAFLSALHQHWQLAGDEALPGAATQDVAYAVSLVDRALRRRPGPAAATRFVAALVEASALLRAAGELDAAAEVAARAAANVGHTGLPGPHDASPEGVDELLRVASATWTWVEPWLGARVLLGVRAALVSGVSEAAGRHPGQGDADHPIDVLPGWRQGWRGQGLEVHGLPVGRGRLSYALRWHGDRPALLWEVVTADGVDVPVTLRAPTLDPVWSAEGARGEALLNAPPSEEPGGWGAELS